MSSAAMLRTSTRQPATRRCRCLMRRRTSAKQAGNASTGSMYSISSNRSSRWRGMARWVGATWTSRGSSTAAEPGTRGACHTRSSGVWSTRFMTRTWVRSLRGYQ